MTEAREPLSPGAEERLARYRAGAMDPAEREAFEREVLASDALAEALYSEQSLDDVRVKARRPTALHGVAVAAGVLAVAAAALLWPRPAPDGRPPAPEVLRGEETPGVAARLIEPLGTLSGPPERFLWSRDPAAELYRLEVFDASGELFTAAVLRDTFVTAAAVGADSLRSATWRVVPIAADGLERPAQTAARFEVARP
jgi:hypothetical protein